MGVGKLRFRPASHHFLVIYMEEIELTGREDCTQTLLFKIICSYWIDSCPLPSPEPSGSFLIFQNQQIKIGFSADFSSIFFLPCHPPSRHISPFLSIFFFKANFEHCICWCESNLGQLSIPLARVRACVRGSLIDAELAGSFPSC